MGLVAMEAVPGATMTGAVSRGKPGDSFDLMRIGWREVGVPEKLHWPLQRRLRGGGGRILCGGGGGGGVCRATRVGTADGFWTGKYAMLEKDGKWRGKGNMMKKVDRRVRTRVSSPISFPSSWYLSLAPPQHTHPLYLCGVMGTQDGHFISIVKFPAKVALIAFSVCSQGVSKQADFPPRCSAMGTAPQSRDMPPKRDTGIASEKDWGINLLNEHVNESGINEDGSTWYHESGTDLGENGYRCHWARMGGQSYDGTTKWKEMWWEKSDWTGYKELGVEKTGKNIEGDSWWETWQEMLYQDEWSNLARIERSAQKQAKSGTETAGWFEKWWEKYDAKGWTEKGANKYGRLNEQSWWEKWGENYDGGGYALKWTDKWAETQLGIKWGDKWEEKFFSGIGSRQGETWHVSPADDRWSRTWGEEHFGNG